MCPPSRDTLLKGALCLSPADNASSSSPSTPSAPAVRARRGARRIVLLTGTGFTAAASMAASSVIFDPGPGIVSVLVVDTVRLVARRGGTGREADTILTGDSGITICCCACCTFIACGLVLKAAAAAAAATAAFGDDVVLDDARDIVAGLRARPKVRDSYNVVVGRCTGSSCTDGVVRPL